MQRAVPRRTSPTEREKSIHASAESIGLAVDLCAMELIPHFDLRALNTFHIQETCTLFAGISSESELLHLLQSDTALQQPLHVLGGGSNVLLTRPVEGLVLHNRLQGIHVMEENEETVTVEFGSGEEWHHCVMWCVAKGWSGIENLALIPGTIGAAPIQNIGAYGAELKDVFHSLQAIHLKTLNRRTFTRDECRFGYRDSIFKQEEKGNWFILSVTLTLQKHPALKVDYGDIRQVLESDFGGKHSIQNVADAVIRIRRSKLPDPAVIGNAGSFFKNPVIEASEAERLLAHFPDMPQYASGTGVKIPAAWLIERCGWKGFKEGDMGVHNRQALVLVNYANASGTDIYQLSTRIITSVQQRFNILLEREVNVW